MRRMGVTTNAPVTSYELDPDSAALIKVLMMSENRMPNIEPEPSRRASWPGRSPVGRFGLAPEKPRDRLKPRLRGRAVALACTSGRPHQLYSSIHTRG